MIFKRVLITGGCGFLGQYLVNDLLAEFPELRIRVADLKKNRFPVSSSEEHPNVELLLDKDICDPDSIREAFDGVDAVIHLAGVVSFSLKDAEILRKVNVEGTKNLLKLALDSKVRVFYHVSSVAALGYSDDEHKPVHEDFEFDWSIAEKRNKHYMLTKYQADLEVERFRRRGLRSVILYPGLMYGPGDIANSSRIIKAIKDKRLPFNMPGGTNVIDVRDVARGIVAALKSEISSGNYLLSGHNMTFEEMNSIIADEVGTRPPLVTMPRFMNSPLYRIMLAIEKRSKKKTEVAADNVDSSFKFRYFDNSKAKDELGWTPEISFSQTIKDTVEWLESNGHLEG